MSKITQKQLKKILSYDKNTGVFIWIVAKAIRVKIGDIAGNKNKVTGYARIHINGKLYQTHRLAWLYEFGNFPHQFIDHINHNRQDNRICNLREVSMVDNNKNASIRKDNKYGVIGVYLNEYTNKWTASIGNKGKKKHLGTFSNFSEAHEARKNAEFQYGFHKNHGKKA